MNKTELLRETARRTNFTQKDVKAVMEALQEITFENLQKDEEVKIMDGVTLTTISREAYTGRNPMTGEPIEIPSKRAPKCKFGTAIKNVLN